MPRQMHPDEWHKVKELFASALEQPPPQRAAFLVQHCDDAFIRAEVEALLAASDEPNHIIESQALNLAAAFPKTPGRLDGRQFGSYRIIREIGSGGMGAVFLAERTDGQFEQRVALKIIRQSLADAEIERHFKRERQILASLNHPNIARLLDGGVSDSGEPFIAMEYVEGKPLISFAAEHALDVEQRLRLFVRICAAIAYAHRNLVVHRDIKPSNILVGSDGEPKLLDFGLARMTDFDGDSNKTVTALRAFTPAYASPEQLRGQPVTTASDIYSLGVVLYELLTEQRPLDFDSDRYEEILRVVCETTPKPPSERFRQVVATLGGVGASGRTAARSPRIEGTNLRGDLDTIVLMAIRKEPERRYPTVEQFANDIERHLQRLPITARPNTLRYRARKFIQRNRVAVFAGLFVMAALISGLTVALWQAQVARRERDRAERRFNDVRQLSNSLLFEITPKIERLEGSVEAREVLVKRALEYLDSLARESGSDRQLQNELASAYEKIGALQGEPGQPNLSDFSGALRSYEKAQAIRKTLLELNPGGEEERRLLATNFSDLGRIRSWVGDSAGSLKDSETALEFYSKLVAERPDSIPLRMELAEAQFSIAYTHYFANQIGASYPYLHQALSSLERLRAQRPADTEVLRLLSRGYTQLGIALSWDGRQAEGEAEMSKALEIGETLAARNPNDAVLSQALFQTYIETSSLYEQINNQLSMSFLRKALAISELAVRNDAANIQARQNLAKAYSKLGVLFNNLGEFKQAVSALDKSLEILRNLERNEPKNLTYKADLARNHNHLGIARSKLRNLPEALESYQKAASIFESIISADSRSNTALRNLATVFSYIAETHQELGRTERGSNREDHLAIAKANYQRALDILERLEKQNALPEFDRKFLNEMKVAVSR